MSNPSPAPLSRDELVTRLASRLHAVIDHAENGLSDSEFVTNCAHEALNICTRLSGKAGPSTAALEVEALAESAMEGFSRLAALAMSIKTAREKPQMVLELAAIAEDMAAERHNVVDCIRNDALRILCLTQGGEK